MKKWYLGSKNKARDPLNSPIKHKNGLLSLWYFSRFVATKMTDVISPYSEILGSNPVKTKN